METPRKKTTIIAQVSREMQIQNYSERTIKVYISSLHQLDKFYSKHVDQVSVEEFKDFLHHRIKVDKVSPSTINQTISVFRIVQESILGKKWDPIKIKRPRRRKTLPVILSEGEIQKMLRVTINMKHRAIIALAYSTGMRREEIRNLKHADVDSALMQIHVRQGKGKKDRYTILSKKALELLRSYYILEKPKIFLFEPIGRKGIKYGASTLNTVVKNAAMLAEIKKKISIHTLRHCFATHLVENGINLAIVQQFMGHTSIKTTTLYLHLAKLRPSTISSPLDKMDI